MSNEEPADTAKAGAANVPVGPLILGVVLATVLATAAVGGVAYWGIRTGRLPIAGVKTVTTVIEEPAVKTKLMQLDPLLVNLADADGKGYLRLALTLKVEDRPDLTDAKAKDGRDAKGSPKNEFEAEERDAALGILGKETSDTLLASDGKERLKKDLKATFAEHVPEVRVVDVLITEFLVQR